MVEPKDRAGLLHKEYERLYATVHSYSHSSFDDFKLLGALGLVFAWDPIVSFVKTQTPSSSNDLLFVGFVVALVLSAIVSVRDLLKQSIMIFNHSQLGFYESQLRELLQQEATGTFRSSQNWSQWFRSTHGRIALWFYGLYSFSIISFSAAVLYWRTGWKLAAAYVCIAILVSVFPMSAVATLYKQFSPSQAKSVAA